jgi:prepilin-type N-terminal cleavage/methylation domain-containing protein
MKTSSNLRIGQKGFTLVEMLVVVSIIAIITPALTYLFTKVGEGMAADEMHTQLQRLNEKTMLRFHDRLSTSKRFFQNTATDKSFLALVQLSGSAPPVLANSLLATSQTVNSTGGTFSPSAATKAYFGNSMFFAAYDVPATINGLAYTSPLTIRSTASSPVSYQQTGGNGPATVILDVYRFYYYYLTATNDNALINTPSYRLVEWRSVQYADYYEINSIADGTLQQDVINWLATPGNVSPNNPAYSINLAWDHTSSDPTQAFYKVEDGQPNDGASNLIAAPVIQQADWNYLTHVSSGILSNGFKYGISCNSAQWGDCPATVPYFGVENDPFPGGFEVGISGNASGAQVLIRSLLVSKGYAPRVIYNDITSVNNVRDVW